MPILIERPTTFIERLEPSVPDRYVFSRLKLPREIKTLDEKTMNFYRKNFNIAKASSQCSGAYAIFHLENLTENEISFGNLFTIKSANLAAFLKHCDYIILMAVTAGIEIVNEIEKAIRTGNGASAIIIDAAASEIADAAMDELNSIIAKSILAKGRKITNSRFSPGFGDISLEVQKIFYSILQMDKLGVKLLPSMQFVPEKTVTAFAGVLRSG